MDDTVEHLNDNDIYVASGRPLTRREIRDMYKSGYCPKEISATVLAFGFAIMFRDDGVDQEEALRKILAWARPPPNKHFLKETSKGVAKVYGEPNKHAFVSAT